MRRTKIKICGNTNKKDAVKLSKLPVDAIGFIVTKKDYPNKISPVKARKVVTTLVPFISTVLGLSLEHRKIENLYGLCQKVCPDILQIQHGGTKEEIEKIRNNLPWLKIIKTINVFDESALGEVKSYYKVADMILIDNKGSSKNKKLEFEKYLKIAKKITRNSPIPTMLAGGLNIDNIEKAITTVHPYAVDLISGVETKPGKKDFHKVEKFILKVQEVDGKIYVTN
jgi:phosphoribosylanthranilate isomerase